MSPVRVTTSEVAARERADMVRNVVWDNLVRVELDYEEPDVLAAKLTLGQADNFTVCTAEETSTSTTMRRTRSLIRDDAEPCVFLGIQLSGSSIIIQHDREVVLRPGEMVLYDATQPYTHVNSSGLHKACFRIPRTALGLSQKAVEAVSVTSLNGDSPVAQIAAGYFADVARHVHELGDGLDELAAPSIALARAVILNRLGQSPLTREALEATLVTQALEYAGKHLGDRDLCAERVAAHLHVSVRHLYKVLEAAQIGFSDWVRRERLERCRLELSQADAPPVAVVASRWGFTEASHFSRVFRQAYDMSPRELRRQIHNEHH